MEALVVSNLVLWVAVLALLGTVFALARQIGILYERIAPMGALMLDSGPKVGDAAPAFDLVTLDGEHFATGGPRTKSLLLFFLSPTCPVCKKLLPILRRIAVDEKRWLDLAFASDGDRDEHEAFRIRAELQQFPYLLSPDLGMAYRIGKLPYAVLLDEDGHVRAKGLVNSREQLESLFTARELGVASVQEFLGKPMDLEPDMEGRQA
ncbi:MAG TPA: methylamine dehydrogenase accessory protein MauD [Burkholderiaceae bacterium]|nr:methylamine dehydrogenase accessory protein MauD [Burkholderiaceae bacterium]HRA77340.1 methylamine dehydrogenase accessory protein MauD [Burkholderiaceae bacterium]